MCKTFLALIAFILIVSTGCSYNTAARDKWEVGENTIDTRYLLSDRIENKKLLITETAAEAGTAAGMFPIQVNCNIIVSEKDRLKEWAIEKTEFRTSHFILRRDAEARVYITKASDNLRLEADSFEITGYLKKAGVDISNIAIHKTELDYRYSNCYLNFEISDGKKSAFFLSRWSPYDEYLSRRDEKKHVETIPLHQYKIIDTAFKYEYDNGMDIHEIYVLKDRNRYYLILWEERLKKFSRYEIPAGVGVVEELYYNTSPRTWQSGEDLEMLGALYLKAKNPKSGEICVYRVDLPEGVMKKFGKAAELEEKYPLKWKFTGELKYNYILHDTGKTLVLYGDDGGISGLHSHKYLYGIDRETGKKIWQVYGGYKYMDFSLSRDGKCVYTAVQENDQAAPKLVCIDMDTGRLIWDKVFPDFVHGLVHVTAVEGGAAAEFSSYSERGDVSGRSLRIYGREDGSMLWEKKLSEGEYLVTGMDEAPNVLVSGNSELKACAVATGAVKWTVQGRLRAESREMMTPYPEYPVLASPEFISKIAAENRRWFAFEEGFKELDLASGKILNYINAAGNVQAVFLDDTLAVIKNTLKETRMDAGILPKEKGFALYSLTDKRELWNRDEVFYGAVLYGNKLVYYTNSHVRCVDRDTGETEWESKLPLTGGKAALTVGKELILSNSGRLLSFDISTGKLLYQESHYFTGGASWRDRLNYYSTMYKAGDGLIISNIGGEVDFLDTVPGN